MPHPEQYFVLTPVRSEREATAEQIIRRLLDGGWYVFGPKTTGLKRLKAGDRICFYQAGVGVVAEATAATAPEPSDQPIRDTRRFPWVIRVREVRYFFDHAVALVPDRRARLDAFRGTDVSESWGWFVQTTRVITEHDFNLLSGRTD
jgi:hypothetical protein